MKNYIDLLRDVLENGIDKTDRTGVGTKSVFGRTLRFNLQDGFPMITTRKVNFRVAFEETMFFLNGETDTKKLEDKKINIWKGNTTREFLDARGLSHLPVGDMGKGYGFQWRNFGGSYGIHNGIDQIKQLLDGLKTDPNGRRHLVTAWNPTQTKEMALPPCHIMHQYVINNGKLDSSFIMRSNDIVYGLPFNIMGYAFLNIAFSEILGVQPGELVYFGGDVHIYNNQLEMATEQITRTPYALPKLVIKKQLKTLDDLLNLNYTDIEIKDYISHPDFKNKPAMAV